MYIKMSPALLLEVFFFTHNLFGFKVINNYEIRMQMEMNIIIQIDNTSTIFEYILFMEQGKFLHRVKTVYLTQS